MHTKTIIITGATGAIGRALAEAMAIPTKRLCLLARNADALNRLADELRPQCKDVHVLPVNLESRVAMESVAKSLSEHYEKVDTLIDQTIEVITAIIANRMT